MVDRHHDQRRPVPKPVHHLLLTRRIHVLHRDYVERSCEWQIERGVDRGASDDGHSFGCNYLGLQSLPSRVCSGRGVV